MAEELVIEDGVFGVIVVEGGAKEVRMCIDMLVVYGSGESRVVNILPNKQVN